jgi:hypothetical protein
MKAWVENSVSLDVEDAVYCTDTVIMDFCLPMAVYMGFTEIYLLGCDTDYCLDKAEDFSHAYFYDVTRLKQRRRTPEYIQTQWYDNVIRSYELMKTALDARGVRVYNATQGGRLEVFERISLGDIVHIR